MKKSRGNSPSKQERTPPYREFERAVCDFVKALDPSAKVMFDHNVPDRDTGTLRQVDGWVEAKVLSHYPVSVLVSCKAQNRKVDIQKMGTFVDEVRSIGASFGIIYSTLGFTAPALQKAEAHGLSCCRLYREQPADIPQTLFLWSYCCQPAFSISLMEGFPTKKVRTWSDLFELKIGIAGEAKTVLERLEHEFRRQEDAAVENLKKIAAIPSDWAVEHSLAEPDNSSNRFVIRVAVHWRVFCSRLEGHVLNGSYCFQNQSFVGSVAGPSLDMASSHPGAGWEETTERDLPRNCILIIRRRGGFKEAALTHYGPQLIGN